MLRPTKLKHGQVKTEKKNENDCVLQTFCDVALLLLLIYPGTFVTLMGACGKTTITTIRMMVYYNNRII